MDDILSLTAKGPDPPLHVVEHLVLDFRTPSIVIRVMESFKDLFNLRHGVRQRNEIATHLRDDAVRVAVVAPCSDNQIDAVLDHNLGNLSSRLI